MRTNKTLRVHPRQFNRWTDTVDRRVTVRYPVAAWSWEAWRLAVNVGGAAR